MKKAFEFMDQYPVEVVQEFYEEKYKFTVEARPDDGSTEMTKNCIFKAKYFVPAKGSGVTEGTEPDWRTTDNGKEYCLVMGYAKINGVPEIGTELQKCILNKVSYDKGDFEMGVPYSSMCKIPMLDGDGNKHQEFNDIYFTVFENKATNNDMSDLVGSTFQKWMDQKKAANK